MGTPAWCERHAGEEEAVDIPSTLDINASQSRQKVNWYARNVDHDQNCYSYSTGSLQSFSDV